jgi:DNA-binding CsgD family transcriptional regulator
MTERELEAFRLIARGLSNAIGRELYISDTTVKTHITHILMKLSLRDRVQAVVLASPPALFAGPAQQDRRNGQHDQREDDQRHPSRGPQWLLLASTPPHPRVRAVYSPLR